jgi:hypothetical protein
MPYRDGKSCSSPPWAFLRMSGPRTQNMRPSLCRFQCQLWFHKINIGISLTKIGRSTSFNNRTLWRQSAPNTILPIMSNTYRRPSLEHNRLMPRPLAVRESANRLGSLILKACEQLVELLNAQRLKKPFSWKPSVLLRRETIELQIVIHIRSRQLVKSVKTQTRIFDQNRSADLYRIQ